MLLSAFVLLPHLPVDICLPILITGLVWRQGEAVELPDSQAQTVHEMLIKLEAAGERREEKNKKAVEQLQAKPARRATPTGRVAGKMGRLGCSKPLRQGTMESGIGVRVRGPQGEGEERALLLTCWRSG